MSNQLTMVEVSLGKAPNPSLPLGAAVAGGPLCRLTVCFTSLCVNFVLSVFH